MSFIFEFHAKFCAYAHAILTITAHLKRKNTNSILPTNICISHVWILISFNDSESKSLYWWLCTFVNQFNFIQFVLSDIDVLLSQFSLLSQFCLSYVIAKLTVKWSWTVEPWRLKFTGIYGFNAQNMKMNNKLK